VDDVFVNTVVQKKEPTTFKPQPGMAFKLRQLMCWLLPWSMKTIFYSLFEMECQKKL